MSGAFVADADRYDSTVRRAVPLKTLATDLFENWAVPFEIASVVLLVALIGAVVIGRTGPEEDATPAVEGEPEDSYQAERPRRGPCHGRVGHDRGAHLRANPSCGAENCCHCRTRFVRIGRPVRANDAPPDICGRSN